MTAIPSFPTLCFVILALGVSSVTGGCKEQQVPRTPSGEPIPFDRVAAFPGSHPPVSADAEQGSLNTKSPARPSARSFRVTVRLATALAARAAPGDTVFIFARAAQGPRLPLAIVRTQVKNLPATVILDDSMAMVPEMKMSSFPELVIGARVSKSGDAVAKPGDLEGYTPVLKAGAAGPVEVVITSVIGNTAPPVSGNRPADAVHAAGSKHASAGVKTRLNIPADVQAKWKTVELSVAGKDIAPHKLRIAIGGEMGVGKSGLTLRVVAYVPAFQSDAGVVTSASNKPDNPAALIQLVDKARVLNEGWVFQKLPDFNTFPNDRLNIQLLAAQTIGSG